MNTKLTLSIDKSVTEKAKKYARKKKTSLSKLVENQLELMTSNDAPGVISPLVKSISGVISQRQVHDRKNKYAAFLKKKYK